MIRPDGFVSVQGPYQGGELVTKPFRFTGSKLSINFATSAVGGIFVEMQTPEEKPIEGFLVKDCQEIIGDRIDYNVHWKHGKDVNPRWQNRTVCGSSLKTPICIRSFHQRHK